MVFPRNIEKEILDSLHTKRALFILGSRRVGKTTLMKSIQSQITNEPTMFFDLERDTDIELFKLGIENFISYLEMKGVSKKRRIIVFIDEIQYLDEFSNFVKLAVDHYSHRIKLILSGSSAAQIKVQFRDSLVGRKFIYEIRPLSFREFLQFKEKETLLKFLNNNFHNLKPDLVNLNQEEIKNLYEEYIIYGGYPEIAITPSVEEKKLLIREFIQGYVLKDIRNFFSIEKIDEFNRLIRLLAIQSGGLLSIQSISKESNLDMRTLKRYIQILKDTFIIDILPPLFSNKRKELKKMPKVFMMDTGVRNSLIENFTPFKNRTDKGELIETQCFSALKPDEFSSQQLYFWRTQDGKEVDFVSVINGKYIPYEVKVKMGSINHLKFFKKLYKSPEMNLILFDQEHGMSKESLNIISPWFLRKPKQ